MPNFNCGLCGKPFPDPEDAKMCEEKCYQLEKQYKDYYEPDDTSDNVAIIKIKTSNLDIKITSRFNAESFLKSLLPVPSNKMVI